MSDWIRFMGTAGARFVVSKQLCSSAGTWCCFKGCKILIDPGPGTLRSCFYNSVILSPEELDAVILTHRHLDHSCDVNVIIEAMTQGTFNRRGTLYAPEDAVSGFEPVVFSHVRKSIENLVVLRERGSYKLGDLYFETPLKHHHSVETYGLKFFLDRACISFIADSKFSEDIIDSYKGSDLLVMNVLFKKIPTNKDIKHLDLEGAAKLIMGIKPRLAVMTHFGLTMLKENPALLAEELTEKTGVKVLAASDGLVLKPEEVLF
ncbi:MAG: MBL fold metallo-hydrolase [Bacillota bacterium]